MNNIAEFPAVSVMSDGHQFVRLDTGYPDFDQIIDPKENEVYKVNGANYLFVDKQYVPASVAPRIHVFVDQGQGFVEYDEQFATLELAVLYVLSIESVNIRYGVAIVDRYTDLLYLVAFYKHRVVTASVSRTTNSDNELFEHWTAMNLTEGIHDQHIADFLTGNLCRFLKHKAGYLGLG